VAEDDPEYLEGNTMLMTLEKLYDKYMRGAVTGVIHAGAHDGEEYEEYRNYFGAVPITWIEADPEVADRLLHRMTHDPLTRTISAVIADEVGREVTFHRANNEQSSSFLELGTHALVHPEVEYVDSFQAVTMTLDSLPLLGGNFLNMDLQGAEGMAIAGAGEFIKSVDYVYTEVNREALYRGCTLFDQFVPMMGDLGFRMVESIIYENLGWGDAFFVRDAWDCSEN